ncbi:MAG TPA: hypothetical protein PK176_08030, partial [Acidobacteriota bacterium]|nr:hypothetical protein [Acidobacteriota bacterium]
MGIRIIGLFTLLIVTLGLTACGGGETPSGEPAAASQPADSAPAAAPAKAGLQKIGDMAEAWNELYKQNEEAINNYEGMPIMELVTPAT